MSRHDVAAEIGSFFITSFVYISIKRKTPSIDLTNNSSNISLSGLLTSYALTSGNQPSVERDIKIIPPRDTVAGDALSRFPTSNNIFILLVIRILSEFARVSVLLSSSTVFIDSIHNASTGPSSVSHV